MRPDVSNYVRVSKLTRGTLGMEIRHVFFHTFLARARSPDIYNRAQWYLHLVAGTELMIDWIYLS